MSLTIKLPSLKNCARRNFCSSVIGACNRVFAIYQVDVANKPFWVMEMDYTEGYELPLKGMVTRFESHTDAISHLASLATNAIGGDPRDVYWPMSMDDSPSLDDTFHRIEMDV